MKQPRAFCFWNYEKMARAEGPCFCDTNFILVVDVFANFRVVCMRRSQIMELLSSVGEAKTQIFIEIL